MAAADFAAAHFKFLERKTCAEEAWVNVEKSNMRSRRYRVANKKRLGVCIAALVLLMIVLGFAVAQSGHGIGFRETRVSGLKGQLNPAAGTVLKTSFKVSPAKSRLILLQKYDAGNKKWVTAERFRAGSGDQSRVTVAFPETWQKKTYSKWRVYLPAARGGRSYSKTITVTQKNRAAAGIRCKSAVIVNLKTGAVLYDYNMNKRLPNASTTKMMTAIITMTHADPDSNAVITKNVIHTPDGNLYKKKGDIFKLHDLWRAMLIASSNDSAEAVAETTAGSEEKFVSMMNAEVRRMGLKNTHFMNPHGMDEEGHYSSARDLASINARAYKLKEFRTITMEKSVKFRALNHKKRYNVLYTTNDLLLEHYKGCLGGKTGTTTLAGQCYSGIYEYKGVKYVTVVMHSSNRFKDVKKLCKYIRTWQDN